MVKIPLSFIEKNSEVPCANLTIWNGIALFGYDRSNENQTIDFLKTLPTEILLNLAATNDHKGYIWFFWKSESRPHLTESADLLGGYFGGSFFIP